MIRLGWKRFLIGNALLTALTLPFGVDAVSVVFFVAGLAGIVAFIQTVRHHRMRAPMVWYLIAFAIGLFLVGGVAEVLTAPSGDEAIRPYPGLREPFDLAAYITLIGATILMARARLARRDRTIVLDALISMGGVASLAWVGVMSAYVKSDELTTLGKSTGVAFTAVSLILGFVVVCLAIGPGSRPRSYYFMAAAATGSFVAELLIELNLSGRGVPNSEILISISSSLAVTMIVAAGLHPSVAELTEPPTETTPNMTRKRLVAMTFAVLIPPALLLGDTIRSNRYETAAIIGVWAMLSVMVMIRVFALARTRERFSELDRALANADALLVSAANRQEMTDAVLDAAPTIVRSVRAVAVHQWKDSQWIDKGNRKGSSLRPIAERPLPSMTEQADTKEHRSQFDVHFQSTDELVGVVSIEMAVPAEEFELSRIASLVGDFAQALEASTLREELGRERSERRFRALVDNLADIIFVVDDDRTVRYVSPSGPRLLNCDEQEILHGNISLFAIEDHRSAVLDAIDQPGSLPIEVQFEAEDGLTRWFEVYVSDMRAEPEIQGLVVTASEISAQKQAQFDLQRSEARFRSLVRHASDLVVVLDAEGSVTWISPSSVQILGLQYDQVVNCSVLDLVDPTDRHGLTTLLSEAVSGQSRQSNEFRFKQNDAWRTLEVGATNLLDDPTVGGLVLNAHDVTERKALEQNLRHQALHDDLTGLANRVSFRDRMEESLGLAEKLAVLVIDLDDFKTVNDGLGHSVGDELLKVLATRLQQSVRQTELAARLGGDEFAILITDLNERGNVMLIAQRLLQLIQRPIEISGREIVVHASIGVAFADDVKGATPETMLRSADLAMYGAKNRGKSRITIFDESMHEGVFERLELKADLAHALEREELLLHYQPVIHLSTGAISGFEALMRWSHPERGMVGPGTFIPLAEETGLIVPIGRWLADVALGQLKTWQLRYPASPPLTMSINVSGRQLEDEHIVADIVASIERSEVDPSSVIVELTESVVVEDNPDLIERLEEIRAIGVGLHADDFGTGFASYSALQSLPFTGVKIDRSLVDGLDGEAAGRAQAQVSSIIEMAASTGMHVVAEGIESATQAQALRQMQCETAQGFFFARPAEAGSIEAELKKRKVLSLVTEGS